MRKQCRILCTRRLVITTILSYLALYTVISSSLAPMELTAPDEAAIKCITLSLQTEQGIRAATLNYGASETVSLNLYMTSITRTINCTNAANENHLFQYKDDYLNISTVDVDGIFHQLTAKYPINESFDAWYYEDFCNWYRIRDRLDRHCLSSTVIQPSDAEDPADLSVRQRLVHGSVLFVVGVALIIYWIDRTTQPELHTNYDTKRSLV